MYRHATGPAIARAGGRLAAVELREWIVDEHANVQTRFEQSVVAAVPLERWTDPAGAGGSSIAFLAFHSAYHADLAANAVLGGADPVLVRHRAALGIAGLPGAIGLAESEPAELTAALDLDALLDYVRAVHHAGAQCLDQVDPTTLARTPDGAAGLAHAGVDEAAVPWLYRMWDRKPASWFVQWEVIGHRVNHVGEMVSVRNRLGLSPF
jgi:hypothetical protein